MVFPLGSLADDARAAPAQAPEVHRQRDSRETRCRGRTQSFADWEAIVNVQRKSRSGSLLSSEDVFVRLKDQMVFNRAADFRIMPAGINRIMFGACGTNAEIKVESQRGCVKRRPQVGG